VTQLQIDTSVTHSARFWNYLLGSKDNYSIDREAIDRILALIPSLRDTVRAERGFLIRAVGYLAGEGADDCARVPRRVYRQ
jgi:S-adenosyl methyltransferase